MDHELGERAIAAIQASRKLLEHGEELRQLRALNLPRTHRQYLDLLIDTVHRIVEFSQEELKEEFGVDELAFYRHLGHMTDVRHEVSSELLHHQLKMEGCDVEEVVDVRADQEHETSN